MRPQLTELSLRELTMITSVRNTRCSIFVSFIAVALLLRGHPISCAAEVAENLPPESGMRQHPVALDRFEQLRAGLKRAEVESLLRKRGEHQFTYKDDKGVVWQDFQYSVAQEQRNASSGYDFLYKQGALYAVVEYMDVWKGIKALAPTLNQNKDPNKRTERYIQELFRSKALRGDDIAGSMGDLKKHILAEERESKAREKRNPPDPGITVLVTALNLLAPSEQTEFKRAYKTNVEYMAKYDGGKIDIGMTEAQVEEFFGKPLASDKLNEVEQVAIYGSSDAKTIGAVQSWLACGPVAVLFHDGAVLRVMSNWYCDIDWRDRAWPELKIPRRESKD
jgi:hypothetical protein